MAYTWTDLQNKVKRSFNDSTTNVIEYLKEAEVDFAERTDCLEKVHWFYVGTGNNGKYKLPTDLVKIKRVSWDGEIINPIQPYDIHEYYTNGTSVNTGHVSSYFTHGEDIYFSEAPSAGGWATIWYSYVPNALDSTATYKKINYDSFYTGSETAPILIGSKIQTADGNKHGLIQENEFNNITQTGAFTLSDVTGTFANDEALLIGGINVAKVNGAEESVSGHGLSPEIPNKFRLSLVDYAKYRLYLDEEDENRASVYLQLYLNMIDKASASFMNRDDSGPYVVRDVISSNNVI